MKKPRRVAGASSRLSRRAGATCTSRQASASTEKTGGRHADISAAVGAAGAALALTGTALAADIQELFKPKLFLPAHHDANPPAWVDLGLEPMFDKIRAEMPGTAYLAPLYRSPICSAGSGPDKGKVVAFKY